MESEEKATQNDCLKVEYIEEEKAESLMDSLKDPVYRSKLLRWTCIPIVTFSMGLVDSLAGTTNLDLQIITSTNKEMASYFFTAVNLGYMMGAPLGGVLYGKINSNLLMIVTTCLSSVACIGTPYCSTFATIFVIRVVVGLFMGVLQCVNNAEHMKTWGNKGQSLIQLISCVYAFGGVVGPLMTEPFLAEKEVVEKHNSTHYLWNNLTEPTNSTHYLWNNLTEPTNSTQPRTTNVHYAYLIGGIIFIVTIIPAFLALIIPNTYGLQVEEKIDQDNVERKLPLPLNIFMIISLFWYFFAYSCSEATFISFLMIFVVDEYEEVTSHQGAFITTFFWAAFAACRFVSIFTSKYLSPVRQLYLHLSLLVIAFSGFLVSALYSRIDILTGFTCVAGLACSAILPAMISWTEAEVMTVTGPISSVILMGATTGLTVVPIIVGYLMEHMSNMWFCYCLMGTMEMAIVFFVFLLSFNRGYVDKKYGKLGETTTQDKICNIQDPQTKCK